MMDSPADTGVVVSLGPQRGLPSGAPKQLPTDTSITQLTIMAAEMLLTVECIDE